MVVHSKLASWCWLLAGSLCSSPQGMLQRTVWGFMTWCLVFPEWTIQGRSCNSFMTYTFPSKSEVKMTQHGRAFHKMWIARGKDSRGPSWRLALTLGSQTRQPASTGWKDEDKFWEWSYFSSRKLAGNVEYKPTLASVRLVLPICSLSHVVPVTAIYCSFHIFASGIDLFLER